LSDFRVRKRHRLRQKELEHLSGQIDDLLGTRSFSQDDVVDMAEAPEFNVIFVNGKILAFTPSGRPFLTVRGLLQFGASKRYVTVDMGAVKFVYNGADVMGPGIVAVDPLIAEDDLVWVRDERNRQPLAIGRAMMNADAISRKEKGKAVQSIHHVGDKLWLYEEPEE
jgi:PUA domain protein